MLQLIIILPRCHLHMSRFLRPIGPNTRYSVYFHRNPANIHIWEDRASECLLRNNQKQITVHQELNILSVLLIRLPRENFMRRSIPRPCLCDTRCPVIGQLRRTPDPAPLTTATTEQQINSYEHNWPLSKNYIILWPGNIVWCHKFTELKR